jgi:hypothetical protein
MHAGGKLDVQDEIGSPALAVQWHPGGIQLGVARRNGKFSIFDVRRLGSKAVSVCEETFHWEMNKFLFMGGGKSLVASYGHHQRGGFKVLNVRLAHLFCLLTVRLCLLRPFF